MEELWPHLSPADSVVSEVFKENFQIAFEVPWTDRDLQAELRPAADDNPRRREGGEHSDGQEHKVAAAV